MMKMKACRADFGVAEVKPVLSNTITGWIGISSRVESVMLVARKVNASHASISFAVIPIPYSRQQLTSLSDW